MQSASTQMQNALLLSNTSSDKECLKIHVTSRGISKDEPAIIYGDLLRGAEKRIFHHREEHFMKERGNNP